MMKLGVVYYKTASAEADALQEYKTPWVLRKKAVRFIGWRPYLFLH